MKLPGLRHASEATGALVLVALVVFAVAALQAGVLRTWFSPPLLLRVILPAEGSGGLGSGSEVEILGTRAGRVRRVVISAEGPMVAELDLDPAMRDFVRTDSRAVLRKQFGVAGAAFVEITRGAGPRMDWDYAVIPAESDKATTESVGALIEEVRARIFPIIEDTARAMRSVATVVEKIADPHGDVQTLITDLRDVTGRVQRGEGSVGRLLADDRLVRELEETLASANAVLVRSRTVVAELENTTREATAIARNVNRGTREMAELVRRAEGTLAAAQSTFEDLGKTTPLLPSIARNIDQSTAALPGLLVQTQQTTMELERLLTQLRGHWLLGGGGDAPDGAPRLPAREVRP